MADLYMVAVESEGGAFVREPEYFDTRYQASMVGAMLALRHKERVVCLYACDVVRVFEPD